MKIINLLVLALAASFVARADFSYSMTRKSAQGGGQTKTYIKGQKMMIDSGSSVTILDFDAQTITSINNSQKSYTVTKFSDVTQTMSGANITADVKETGQKKTINGFNASEMLMTVEMDSPARAGTKMQMEMHIWISPDVPGAQELRAFYRRNGEHFPWSAMAPGANSSMANAMSDLQRKVAAMNGVPVLEVINMKMGGMSPEQSAQMEQMRARLEAMQAQGGQQGAAAAQALARMGGGGGSGMETTMEAGNFSTASIPDSTFSIPAGYTKSAK